MGGVEGRDGGINGKNNIKAKIPEGNNLRFPLEFNLNSKTFDFGKVHDIGKSRWLGKGLIVDVNEDGKRQGILGSF